MADSKQATDMDLARRIDLVCDRFEGNWRLGRRQNLETYLVSVTATDRDACLKALLELEVELRRADGETPTLAEYLDRFRDQQAVLHAVFKTDRPQDSLVAKQSTLDSQAEQTGTGQRKKGAIRQVLPTQFGRYQVRQQIGAGGMGTVVLAEDTLLGRPVALKIPYLSGTDIDEQIKRFDREARTAAMLRHPNICPIYDFGEIDGTRYISMAYIEGLPLHKYAAENPLDEHQIARLIWKLAGALQDAHENGVVHRDLKPANIMMDKKGEPIVMDFGLAMQMQWEADVRLTQTGMQMGSPAYMPPEQVDGDKTRIGPAADIYSLGVVLYELLTGRIPFEGPTASIFVQIIMKDPVRPSMLRAGLSPELEAICLKMMAKRIEDRYSSMEEVANAVMDFDRRSTLAPQTAEPDSQPDELSKTPTVTAPRDELGSTYQLEGAPPQAAGDTSTPKPPLESQDWVSQAQSRAQAAAATSLRQVLKGKTPGNKGKRIATKESETAGGVSPVSPEAELRMLMLDITNALRDGKTDDLTTKVDRVLELQPDNPAMLRLRQKLQSEHRTLGVPMSRKKPLNSAGSDFGPERVGATAGAITSGLAWVAFCLCVFYLQGWPRGDDGMIGGVLAWPFGASVLGALIGLIASGEKSSLGGAKVGLSVSILVAACVWFFWPNFRTPNNNLLDNLLFPLFLWPLSIPVGGAAGTIAWQFGEYRRNPECGLPLWRAFIAFLIFALLFGLGLLIAFRISIPLRSRWLFWSAFVAIPLVLISIARFRSRRR